MKSFEDDNGWKEWKNHVLSELQRLEPIQTDITDIKVAIGKLKVKSGIWGAIAGIIPSMGVIIYLIAKS